MWRGPCRSVHHRAAEDIPMWSSVCRWRCVRSRQLRDVPTGVRRVFETLYPLKRETVNLFREHFLGACCCCCCFCTREHCNCCPSRRSSRRPARAKAFCSHPHAPTRIHSQCMNLPRSIFERGNKGPRHHADSSKACPQTPALTSSDVSSRATRLSRACVRRTTQGSV